MEQLVEDAVCCALGRLKAKKMYIKREDSPLILQACPKLMSKLFDSTLSDLARRLPEDLSTFALLSITRL